MLRQLFFACILLAGAHPAWAEMAVRFRSPSGNIHCSYYSNSGSMIAACEIRERESLEPVLPLPADCDLDWGDSFYVKAEGEAGLSCHGDTLQDPNSFVLPYGQTYEFDVPGISCTSARDGFTCRNAQGRGFALSRNKQELF